MLANVIELVTDDRAVAMHRVGDLAEMRNDFIGGMLEVAAREHRRAVHRDRLDDDHGGSADSTFLIIAAMAFARQTAFGHICSVSTEDNPVLQRKMGELQGPEKIRKSAGHQCWLLTEFHTKRAVKRSRCAPPPFLNRVMSPGERGGTRPFSQRSNRSPSMRSRLMMPRRKGEERSPG